MFVYIMRCFWIKSGVCGFTAPGFVCFYFLHFFLRLCLKSKRGGTLFREDRRGAEGTEPLFFLAEPELFLNLLRAVATLYVSTDPPDGERPRGRAGAEARFLPDADIRYLTNVRKRVFDCEKNGSFCTCGREKNGCLFSLATYSPYPDPRLGRLALCLGTAVLRFFCSFCKRNPKMLKNSIFVDLKRVQNVNKKFRFLEFW